MSSVSARPSINPFDIKKVIESRMERSDVSGSRVRNIARMKVAANSDWLTSISDALNDVVRAKKRVDDLMEYYVPESDVEAILSAVLEHR